MEQFITGLKNPNEKEITKQRNESLARFLGWYQNENDTSYHPSWWMRSHNAITVAYNIQDDRWHSLPFDRDPKYLLQVIEKIRLLKLNEEKESDNNGDFVIDGFEITLNSFHARLIQWSEEDGWKMFSSKRDKPMEYNYPEFSIYYIIGENAKNYQEMLFLGLSDITLAMEKYKI